MWVGPITAPIGPLLPGRQLPVQFPDLEQELLLDAPTGTAPCRLDGSALGVRRTRHDQETTSRLMGASHQGAHGPHTEIGVHGQGIGSEGSVDTEERLGVGIVGGPDISPLGVHDDQQPGTARVGDQPLQGPEPTPPVPFVEGGLGFDQTDCPDCCAESDVGESVQPVGCVPDSPLVEYRPEGSSSQASGPYSDRTAPNRDANKRAQPQELHLQGWSPPGISAPRRRVGISARVPNGVPVSKLDPPGGSRHSQDPAPPVSSYPS
jgi:hypothetical protein